MDCDYCADVGIEPAVVIAVVVVAAAAVAVVVADGADFVAEYVEPTNNI